MTCRRRRWFAAVLALTAAGLACPAAIPQSVADPLPGARASAVISGDARFEVLSPTLIRTEYAGDAHFIDAPTFNAIGRDGFAPTHFTTRTTHGWLTIQTQALTLRYKVGSGPFGADNLQVGLRAGQQQVTADPWAAQTVPTCTIGVLCEAEDLSLNGVSVASDHSGYTGRGFAAGFQSTGNSLSFQVNVTTAGTYQFDARYANSLGGDGQDTTRTLTVSVDGGTGQTLTMPTTADWNTWAIVSTDLALPAGTHTITVARTASDPGNVNIDSLALVTPGAAYPAPPPPKPQTCQFGTVCEAESGTLGGSAAVASDHNDYSGTGFVAGLGTGASDTMHIAGVPRAATYALQLRYANAQPTPRPVSVQVGSAAAALVSLPTTSSWDSWRTVAFPVKLAAGSNDVTIGCPDANSCQLNIDTVAVAARTAPLLAPHAPLGGYRRGLDGVNGSATTTPGLLYQDGWTLLNDTASAIFDNAAKKVSPRPGHGGQPYQDGYVFGYGHEYQQGLTDLATLTGPSELLPRWAYGVWYSEYYNRTAADYENVILPKFRSDGVPLDVLVTDTDYKSPSTWDGWEMDPGKFPDPKAFFAWSKSQGLHNTLNIHPSISSSDPQLPQAQATAKGGLTSSGGNYVFDWGNPDQLKAYFGLHQTMEQDGADFWWLDWCCDQSYSSLPGVTPDAWINQQYAIDTAKNIGRGFAFSRAYGSLQAGGYSGQQGLPTGPWADKRTTVHFTGDTTSDWPTLKFEVGYTPGESASTGLSAVSHDIGGFNNDGTQTAGAEPGSTKEADDLYARWVQFGTFQPIDRLHGNHSDRLPWQYGPAAKTSAEKFLNLRENLVPYTYTLAEQANRTGIPVVRPLYLQYPEQQDAYAEDGSEYLYGPDVLVAPVTTPGMTATTSVWFPPGSTWTDYFTGQTYAGGTTQDVTTDLGAMPVFLRSGGIMTTRTGNVTNDVQNPLAKVTVTVAGGRSGSFAMYEDNGTTTDLRQSATTRISYTEGGPDHTVRIAPAAGSFTGQVPQRQWTVAFLHATAPTKVTIDGRQVPASSWRWDAATTTLTVTAPAGSVHRPLMISYR
ncbi:MAG TPA: TIM-barrel domain-containing protein [Streptosporangiaceae bacterium]|nr:TIM-barrel domain-containing protein [Streptosporangiaceae bacterium]